jgi:hypothetical protein
LIAEAALHFVLADGRNFRAVRMVPALRDATETQRHNWRLIGESAYWPEIDEDSGQYFDAKPLTSRSRP